MPGCAGPGAGSRAGEPPSPLPPPPWPRCRWNGPAGSRAPRWRHLLGGALRRRGGEGGDPAPSSSGDNESCFPLLWGPSTERRTRGWPVNKDNSVLGREGAKRAQGVRRGRRRRGGCLAAGTWCAVRRARRGVPLALRSHVGILWGNKMRLGVYAFRPPHPAAPGRGGESVRDAGGDAGLRDGRAARWEPPVSPRGHTKSPGCAGRERAWARRVPRATKGVIPQIFVQTSTCQPSLQPFPFFFFFPLNYSPHLPLFIFFFPGGLTLVPQLRGAAARYATPAQMQHPSPPQARCGAGLAAPCRSRGREGRRDPHTPPHTPHTPATSPRSR